MPGPGAAPRPRAFERETMRKIPTLFVRNCHVHVFALPQDLVVKDELILILDKGDRNPEFNQRARLAFGNPARVFLENRKRPSPREESSRPAEAAAPPGQSAAGA